MLALEMNIARAYLAVINLGQWQTYFDADIALISELIQVLPMTLSEFRTSGANYHLNPSSVRHIATQIAMGVAHHNRVVGEARERSQMFDLKLLQRTA